MDRRACLKISGAALIGLSCADPAYAWASGGRNEGKVRVSMQTPYGPILMVLDLDRAPISAGAFLACVDAKAYDGGSFTRVVNPGNDHGVPVISVVQGGTRDGAPTGATVAHETTQQTGLRHLDGVVSLPRGGVGTATGAGFFICIGDQPGLDFGAPRNPDAQGFAAFGRVTEGMEVVRRIWGMKADGPSDSAYTKGQMLQPPVPILSVKRV